VQVILALLLFVVAIYMILVAVQQQRQRERAKEARRAAAMPTSSSFAQSLPSPSGMEVGKAHLQLSPLHKDPAAEDEEAQDDESQADSTSRPAEAHIRASRPVAPQEVEVRLADLPVSQQPFVRAASFDLPSAGPLRSPRELPAQPSRSQLQEGDQTSSAEHVALWMKMHLHWSRWSVLAQF
jgi:hypothetical protein